MSPTSPLALQAMLLMVGHAWQCVCVSGRGGGLEPTMNSLPDQSFPSLPSPAPMLPAGPGRMEPWPFTSHTQELQTLRSAAQQSYHSPHASSPHTLFLQPWPPKIQDPELEWLGGWGDFTWEPPEGRSAILRQASCAAPQAGLCFLLLDVAGGNQLRAT